MLLNLLKKSWMRSLNPILWANKQLTFKPVSVLPFRSEFCLLLVGSFAKQDVAEFAQKILDAIAQPYSLGEQTVDIQASIGIALSIGILPVVSREFCKTGCC